MNARELLHELENFGITVMAQGGRLLVHPASRLNERHRQALHQAKAEVLRCLAPCGDSRYLEIYEERAGIMEFDSGMCRAEAETAAQALIAKFRLSTQGGS